MKPVEGANNHMPVYIFFIFKLYILCQHPPLQRPLVQRNGTCPDMLAASSIGRPAAKRAPVCLELDLRLNMRLAQEVGAFGEAKNGGTYLRPAVM